MQPRERVMMLVEDNPDDETLCLRALKRNSIGHRVVVARDGVEAIDYLHGGQHGTGGPPCLPEFILLDLNMPRMNGFEVLRAIRAHERTRYVPVVVLTTSVNEDDVVRSYASGANSFVRKSVDFLQFSEAVRHLGTYWSSVSVPTRGDAP